MSIFSPIARRQLLRGSAVATLIATIVVLSLVFGPVSGALALAFIEGVILIASVGASLKAATRVGDLYADTLARSTWPGHYEEK